MGDNDDDYKYLGESPLWTTDGWSTAMREDPKYGFGFQGFNGNLNPKCEPACTNPEGHMFEEQASMLLSYPRQHVWVCIHCPVVRHVAEKLPEPRRSRDPR